MRELDERIEAQGGVGTDDDVGTRGGFGSAATMVAKAQAELGYRETGENDTKYNRWLGRSRLRLGGLRLPVVPRLPVLVPGELGQRRRRAEDGRLPAGGEVVHRPRPLRPDAARRRPRLLRPGRRHARRARVGVTPDPDRDDRRQHLGRGRRRHGALQRRRRLPEDRRTATSRIFGYGSPQYSMDAVPRRRTGTGGAAAAKP